VIDGDGDGGAAVHLLDFCSPSFGSSAARLSSGLQGYTAELKKLKLRAATVKKSSRV
jgi:hypothetical protein